MRIKLFNVEETLKVLIIHMGFICADAMAKYQLLC